MHSRWRGGRPYDQNRHSAQRHSNARTMSAHGGSRGGQNNWGDSRDQFASGPQQEQHVPVRGFNAAEAKGALRKGPGGAYTTTAHPKPIPTFTYR
ncbi:hypothetical protein ABZX51_001892 [Aspergillus tubingensis]